MSAYRLGENLLIVTIFSVYSQSEKAEFFRRYAHCSTLHAKQGTEVGDIQIDCYKYLKSGEQASILPYMQRAGISSISALEKLFESANSYTTIERDILDEKNPFANSSLPELTGTGYALFLRIYNINIKSKDAQIYNGTKNHPTNWRRFCEEVAGNPVFGGFQRTRADYMKFTRAHCKTFDALMRTNDPETFVPMRFSIEEILDFPIPIF